MTSRVFRGSFTQQEPIPEEAIEAAVAVMRSGRLHRYNLANDERGETALLEREFADWQGSTYCLALASGGQSIQIGLRAAEVGTGDRVLTNAFTLAPVPGAIAAVGGLPVLVEIDENLRLDLDDLDRKAAESGAKTLLLSHMRGHLCDMDGLMAVAARRGFRVIEDCAHTMGARWNRTKSGNFGMAACFSTQTYKHMNSGEGGFLTSHDPDFMARATILSGSYMFYDRHGAGPDERHFEATRYQMPNHSARMDALRAAILRPQLPRLEENIARWNALYNTVAAELVKCSAIAVPMRPQNEDMVGSSIQFRVPALDAAGCQALTRRCGEHGVQLKWFGNNEPSGFTSGHGSWQYFDSQSLPCTDRILSTLFDMRLPLTFSPQDCKLIADIILENVGTVRP
ncbi:MAG: DegT/DnrJ/EryC1/StrS aminotransferase family protein [Hyphomicrobiales bacterium]|nr:DegT/DnrJ/EryC1/StrS aminotransferase family protein [Hyphomicrobiales bacterium]MCP4998502.1 DegT/DnrJ/EryC1/StrS aminotransferase family protein [Hyphomicrobiales bacterium]